jgi:hypothetical protein
VAGEPVEEKAAQLVLEARDAPRKGRLRDAEVGRRARERSTVHDRTDGSEVCEIHDRKHNR